MARLRDAGVIAIRDRLRDAEGVRYDRFAVLETTPGGLTPKQEKAVELLRERGGETAVRALEHAGVSASVLSKLVQKGVVRIERRPRRHTLDAFLADQCPKLDRSPRIDAEASIITRCSRPTSERC